MFATVEVNQRQAKRALLDGNRGSI